MDEGVVRCCTSAMVCNAVDDSPMVDVTAGVLLLPPINVPGLATEFCIVIPGW